jgi:phage terminase large subunit-like protein
MKVYAADKETADGVIPTLPIIDEGHRMRDLGLYRLWKGKLEKRHGRIVMISTAGEPGKDFEKTRRALKTTAAKVDRRGRCFGRYESDAAVLHD